MESSILEKPLVKAPKNGILAGGRAAQYLGWNGFSEDTSGLWLVPHASGTSGPCVQRSKLWEPADQFLGGHPVASPHLVRAHLGVGLEPLPRWPGDYTPLTPLERLELAVEHYLRLGLEVPIGLNTPTMALVRRILKVRGYGELPTESYAETRAVQQLRSQGYPTVFRQVPLIVEGRIVNRIDLVVPFRPRAQRPVSFSADFGVALEVDGREFHELQFEKDRRRANNHTVAGTQLLTVTPTRIERTITEVPRWIRMNQNRQ